MSEASEDDSLARMGRTCLDEEDEGILVAAVMGLTAAVTAGRQSEESIMREMESGFLRLMNRRFLRLMCSEEMMLRLRKFSFSRNLVPAIKVCFGLNREFSGKRFPFLYIVT